MSYPIYDHFKFKIGDFVSSLFVDKHGWRSTFQVLTRQYEECSGGVQLHYVCRPQSLMNVTQCIVFNAIELCAYEPEEKKQ